MPLLPKIVCFCLLVGAAFSTNYDVSSLNFLDGIFPNGGKMNGTSIYCELCKPLVDLFLTARKHGLHEGTTKQLIIAGCPLLKSFAGPGVCEASVEMFFPTLEYLLDHNPNITNGVCGIVLQGNDCRGNLHPKWSINIQPKENIVDTGIEKKSPGGLPLKIIHITDVHYDPKYSPSSKNNCSKPICCQRDGEKAINQEESGGFWSNYGYCDVSINLLTNAFEHILQTHNVESVYYTGDLISHRFWDLKMGAFISTFKTVMSDFNETFGRRVFPILGNHDSYPAFQFVPDVAKNTRFSVQWLFDLCADTWMDLLPEGTDLTTIRRGGYYSAKSRAGIRVIGLNSNCAYTFNFWLFLDDKDPYDQLQWLADTLQSAEENREDVHILTHLPPGHKNTYIPWAAEYRRIIFRYSDIIKAVFQGHTHKSGFNIYYQNKEPILMGYNGGSLTPYGNINPNYRVYDVDPNDYNVLDYSDYIIDLTESHNMDQPRWFKLYSFKEEYGVEDMSPKSFHGVVERMTKNETLRNIYYKDQVEDADPAMEKGCGKSCKITRLCAAVTTLYSDQEMCDERKRDYE